MEEIASLFNSIGLILTAVLGGVSVISMSVAALLYMNAHGDPQQTQRAKTAAIGAVVGLILGGLAWVLPGIISRAVIEPAGGQSLTASGSTSGCDQIFRSQLVSQRQINNAARMNELVAVIQNTRDECRRDTWRPVVTDLKVADLKSTTNQGKQSCFRSVGGAAAKANEWPEAGVGNVIVPIGLRLAGGPDNVPVADSGRDRDNNILVFFSDMENGGTGIAFQPPGDGSVCWMYLARASAWSGSQPGG